jgi:hypothetical protein
MISNGFILMTDISRFTEMAPPLIGSSKKSQSVTRFAPRVQLRAQV